MRQFSRLNIFISSINKFINNLICKNLCRNLLVLCFILRFSPHRKVPLHFIFCIWSRAEQHSWTTKYPFSFSKAAMTLLRNTDAFISAKILVTTYKHVDNFPIVHWQSFGHFTFSWGYGKYFKSILTLQPSGISIRWVSILNFLNTASSTSSFPAWNKIIIW